jgi:hypothetical protein
MGATEKASNLPTIYVEGAQTTALRLLMIEDHCGEQPSRAIFQYVAGRDAIAPIAMTPFDNGLTVKYGQRVTVLDTGTTRVIFNGWIMKRSDQGGPDKIIFQAYCDKFLLQYMPVHGCLVRDVDGDLRFSARHNTRFDPDGAWNCTGYEITVGEDTFTVPVFTPNAYRGSTYEAPNNTFDISTLPTNGAHTAWTPRRALEYLCFWANFFPWIGDLPYGMDGTEIAFLASGGPLQWDYDTITGMVGYESPSQPNDPLDRKLQDLVIQGKTLAGAIHVLTTATGTHALRINYDSAPSADPETLTGTSQIVMQSIGWAPQGEGTSISIQRGGSVGESTCDIHDFVFDEDASAIAENVLVLGATKRVETRLTFVRTDATEYDADDASSLVPAWTIAQEQAFRCIIHGRALDTPLSTDPQYALVPLSFGDVDVSTFVPANGTLGRPLVYPITAEAVALARQCFPTVYRAWRVNGYNQDVQDAMTEASDGLSGGVKSARPIMPVQLQFMVKALSGDDSTENRMFSHLPVRIETALDDFASTNYEWQEVPKDIGISCTPDGTIWIEGIAETDPGAPYSVIPFALTDPSAHTTAQVSVRRMRINCAFPTDYRTKGSNSNTSAIVQGSIRTAFAGMPLLRFVDAQGVYRDDMQIESYPAAVPGVYGGASGTDVEAMPLNREVPPGSEQTHAEYAAIRITAKSVNPKRDASFKFIGISTGWRAGDRISYIEFLLQPVPGGGPAQTWTYNLAAPCGSVMHDFLNQITTVGGVSQQFSAGVV